MFMGYSINQWFSIGLYFIMMIILFIGIFITSSVLAHLSFEKKNRIIKTKRKDHKKQIFFDVA